MATSRIVIVCLVYCLILGISGCASPLRAWYDGFQTSAQNNCDKQPPGAREDCLGHVNQKSYDAYEKERSTPR